MTALDDLTLLRSFVRIAESGSISAAARTLDVPQPSLSRHLRMLEERSGVALIRRDTHRMSLTEAGCRLLEDAREMLALAELAEQRMREGHSTLRGSLRVFSSIDIGQFLVARILADFLETHDEVTAQLAYSNRPVSMIEEGFDVGVIVGTLWDEGLVARSAGEISRVLVAAPELVKKRAKAIDLPDLVEWPWLGLVGAHFGDAHRVVAMDKKGRDEIRVEPRMLVEGATALREAVLAGVGIAQGPEWLVGEDLAAGRLVRVCPKWRPLGIPVSVVYASRKTLPARARAFVEFAVEGLRGRLVERSARATR